MQNPSAADRQISASTIACYRAMATPHGEGTWDHDVSQNIEALLSAIAGVSPYRILDLGCGPGCDLVTFRDLGHTVVRLDGCPEFVAMARAVSGCEVWQQDLLSMTLPPASFDSVFANAVLFHLPSRALPGVLDRLHAALKPDGALPPTRVGRTKRASSMAVAPASTASRLGAGWSAPVALPWSTTISARPVSRAASSRGSPRSGARRHRQISVAPAEGATGWCEPGATAATVRTPSSHPDGSQTSGVLRCSGRRVRRVGANCEPGFSGCR